MWLQLVTVSVAMLLAGSSWGAVFSCDEAGLDAAIAAAEDESNPDPGPHTFGCEGPSVIPVTATKVVGADVTLDGSGLVTFDRGDSLFWLARADVSVHQELRDLDLIGGGIRLDTGGRSPLPWLSTS